MLATSIIQTMSWHAQAGFVENKTPERHSAGEMRPRGLWCWWNLCLILTSGLLLEGAVTLLALSRQGKGHGGAVWLDPVPRPGSCSQITLDLKLVVALPRRLMCLHSPLSAVKVFASSCETHLRQKS